jgi:arylsulfatase A-like enzyme
MMYGYEVRYADRCVGRLLDHLRRAGLYERALIIVTGDHGEELWDHGKLGHGHALYDEILHVPLLVKLPGLPRGQRVQLQVRLLDVMPTVLQVAGVRYRGPLRGRSLLKALEPDDEERPLLAEGVLYGGEQKCVRTARYKVIAHGGTRRVEVYDLKADPAEKRDLGANQRIAAAERALLIDWMTAPTRRGGNPAADLRMTPQMLEGLRSLGYVAH